MAEEERKEDWTGTLVDMGILSETYMIEEERYMKDRDVMISEITTLKVKVEKLADEVLNLQQDVKFLLKK